MGCQSLTEIDMNKERNTRCKKKIGIEKGHEDLSKWNN